LTTTYAGFEGESELLEELYRRGLQQPQVGPDLYAGDGVLMFWTHEPQAPWQTPEWIEQMRRSLRANQFLRMIENRFVTSEENFVEMDWWDACTTGRPIAADKSLRVWVGVDASVKRDSTGIAVCTWDHAAKQVRLIHHRIFQPAPNSPVDFETMIEDTLLDIKQRYSVREVRYDPWQMAAVSQRLTRRGLKMVEFPQSPGNLTAASQNLYELIKGGGISVYPDDDIRLAVQRSVALEGTRGWRIAKDKSSAKIDIVVALAQAALGAVQQGERPQMRQGTIDFAGTGKVTWRDAEPEPLRIRTVTREEYVKRNGIV
jgi:phage terminase large subunit-like protein